MTEGKTRRAIVRLLKQEGALDSASLARRLKLTPMAVRQHLYQLQRAKLVAAEERPAPLGEKLRELARVRTEEGYMAEVRREGGSFLFIENHCPICAAANACQGFCSAELDLFRSVLGPGISIERAEHIVSGDRRCVYRITPALAAVKSA